MRKFVNYEFDNGLAIVTVDNPPVNSLGKDVSNELREIFEELKGLEVKDSGFQKTRVEVVILTAVNHKGIFIAGADINLFFDLKAKKDGLDLARFYHSIINPIAEFEHPVICAVNGLALGGGTEVALACDIRIADETAKFGLTEVKLGVVPGGGGTQRLSRLVGVAKAKEMIFTGRRVGAEEALRIGLIEKVVQEGKALNAAKEIAQLILKNAPAAVKIAKTAIDQGLSSTLKQGLLIEQEALGMTCETGEPEEGARAFKEKREPVFSS